MGGYVRRAVDGALRSGSKIIVIDPRKIDIAKKADIWISPKPGTDGVLALGMIKVLIEERLFDSEFVDKWTIGFEKVKEEITSFSLDDVENKTWVPKSKIQDCARLYAKYKPACLMVGNGLERSVHAFQQMRALYIMRALVGTLNTPGGNVEVKPAPFTRPGHFFHLKNSNRLEEIKKGNVVGHEFNMAMLSAYVPTQSLVKGILEEKPNPIKAGICILSNPMISYPDSETTRRGLMKLDFFVVSEIFPTPTTAIADIVLPAAWGAEHDTVGYWPGWIGEIRAYPKLVNPPGEARSDINWLNDLGRRLGNTEYFWRTTEEALDYMLKPSGLSWKEFKQKRILFAKRNTKNMKMGSSIRLLARLNYIRSN